MSPQNAPESINVAIAVISKNNRILISKRPDHVDLGGLWEFPGGKLEAGETAEQALTRECQEELDITPTLFRPLITLHYPIKRKIIYLSVFLVTDFNGNPKGKEGQPVCWVKQPELAQYHFPDINDIIIYSLNLPEHYCITAEVAQDSHKWLAQIEQQIKKRAIKLLQFRSYQINACRRRTLASALDIVCRKYHCQLLVNAPLEELDTVNYSSIHLSSYALKHIAANDLKKYQMVAASCHNLSELHLAEKKGCDFAVLSPVKKTLSHPQAQQLGWTQFHQWVDQVNIPVYALGGMQFDDIETAQYHGAQGIAAIGGCL